jgi:hypothetical protein
MKEIFPHQQRAAIEAAKKTVQWHFFDRISKVLGCEILDCKEADDINKYWSDQQDIRIKRGMSNEAIELELVRILDEKIIAVGNIKSDIKFSDDESEFAQVLYNNGLGREWYELEIEFCFDDLTFFLNDDDAIKLLKEVCVFRDY